MNYKKIQIKRSTNFRNENLLNESTEAETEEQSNFNEEIDSLLQILNSNASLENINFALEEITSLMEGYSLSSEQIFMKFNENDIFDFFFSYIFSAQILSSEIALQNIELIFRILFFFSKSFFFPDSYGFNFIDLFFKNYNRYSLNSKDLGILTVDQIINNSNNDYTIIFDQEAINFLISLFPDDLNSNQLADSLSLFYITIAQKMILSEDILKQIADVLKNYISKLEDYHDGSTYIFKNFTKYMLIYLQHEPPINIYLFNYFALINSVYTFCSDDVDARNNIFDIYTILMQKTKKKFYYTILIGVNPETISSELKEKPGRRLSIFNFFLTAISKGLDVYDYINRTVFDLILKILDELSCECLHIVYQLLDSIISHNQIEQNDHTLEVYSEIAKIFLKMLSDENEDFQTQVLNSIINLCENMSDSYDLEDIKNIFLNCEDFYVLDEMTVDHEEAQFILDNLEISSEN